MNFVVVDVETANQRPSSICQIGIACFHNGMLTETWGELVDPEDSFLPFNTQLHGIGPRDVSSAPTWPDLQPRLRSFLEQHVLASHTFFDRTALKCWYYAYAATCSTVMLPLDRGPFSN